jgi:1-acyl-sn-glycerol-3-phosphate acyltransferase
MALYLLLIWNLLAPTYGVLSAILLNRKEKTAIMHRMCHFFTINIHACKFVDHDKEMKKKIQAAGPTILLYNHRTTADFFLALMATSPGRSCYISRWAVFFLSPIGCSVAAISRGLIFFKRSNKNPQQTRRNLFSKIQKRLNQGISLILFPEGTRHQGEQTLPLKKGALKWAYKNNIKCAIVLQYGNENVLSTKTLKIKRHVTIHTLHEGLYDPDDFPNAQEFIKTIEPHFQSGYEKLKQLAKK